jgi:LysR family nitrogen assimilation transcriptional regulator
MNIHHLRYFVAIVSSGSLSHAAERVYVTQSALSRAVSQLEHELDCQLLERTRHGVVPTSQGYALLLRARRILEECESISQDLKLQADAPHGKVRLAMPTGLRNLLTRPMVRRTRDVYPAIRLEITETTARGTRAALDEGWADLAVLTDGEKAGRLATAPLFTDRLCLVGPPGSALSLRRAVPTSTLRGLPLVLLRSPNNVRAVVDRILRRLGVDEPPVLEANSSQLALSFVGDGHGYTVLPQSAVVSMDHRVGLTLAPLGKLALTWMVAVPQDRPVAHAVRVIAKMLHEIALQPHADAEEATCALRPGNG